MKKLIGTIAALIGVVGFSGSALAAPAHSDSGPTSDAITLDSKQGKTIIGQDFKYPSGTPLVKGRIVEIKPGQNIEWHKHAIPVYAYVISGELKVDYGSKGQKVIPAGESYIEAMNWCHQGMANGKKPAKLLVVYLGQQQPDQIKPEACKGPE